MGEPLDIDSLAAQISELQYCLGQRRRVFPQMVAQGLMKQPEADMHMRRMEAAKRTLEELLRNAPNPERET